MAGQVTGHLQPHLALMRAERHAASVCGRSAATREAIANDIASTRSPRTRSSGVDGGRAVEMAEGPQRLVNSSPTWHQRIR